MLGLPKPDRPVAPYWQAGVQVLWLSLAPRDMQRISLQRGDCAGPAVMYDGSPGTAWLTVETEDEVTTTWTRDEYYRIKCSSDSSPVQETPEEVAVAMQANGLNTYIHRTTEQVHHDPVEYHQRMDNIRARLAAAFEES